MFIGKDSELQRIYSFYQSHWPGPELQEQGQDAEQDDDNDLQALDDDGYDCAEECEEDLLEDDEEDDDNAELCKSLGVVPASGQLVPESNSSSTMQVTPEHTSPEPPSQTPSEQVTPEHNPPEPPSQTPSDLSGPSYVRKAAFEAASSSDLRKQRIEELKLLEFAYASTYCGVGSVPCCICETAQWSRT